MYKAGSAQNCNNYKRSLAPQPVLGTTPQMQLPAARAAAFTSTLSTTIKSG
ncbi:hypothetical protein LTSEMIN_4325 [Salmonella enterica subsp. enterica serovar Minnesota str. A4-603]|nr:hypothetical protein LTSEMIN_4325 [Salmonella enterica subsp. enterica serovar Minnesota str. A4-603]